MNIHFALILTRDCNMRCSYCPFMKEPKTMSVDTMDAVFDLCLRTDAKLQFVNFHGGEPTLEWGLIRRWVDHAEMKTPGRFKYSMCTNGTLLGTPQLEWLRDHAFRLRVSCDGTAGAHTEHRRSAAPAEFPDLDLHSRTVATVREALRLGLDVGVNMVVTPKTVGRLEEGIRTFFGLGVWDVMISPALALLWPRASLVQLAGQLKKVRRFILDSVGHNGRLRWLDDFTRRKGREALYFSGRGGNSTWPLKRMIDYDGNVYADEDLFDPWTHEQLRLGRATELESLADGRSHYTDFFRLMYDSEYFGTAVTRSMRIAQFTLARHHALLARQIDRIAAHAA